MFGFRRLPAIDMRLSSWSPLSYGIYGRRHLIGASLNITFAWSLWEHPKYGAHVTSEVHMFLSVRGQFLAHIPACEGPWSHVSSPGFEVLPAVLLKAGLPGYGGVSLGRQIPMFRMIVVHLFLGLGSSRSSWTTLIAVIYNFVFEVYSRTWSTLTLILLTWGKWWANNASK